MITAFTVCVDYHDIFALTAPLMREKFDHWYVVTSPGFREETAKVCHANDIVMHATDAFYRDGAVFNKFLALEELFDVAGRRGWCCILDADIVWPKESPLDLVKGKLYTPPRYMYPEVNRIPPEEEWSKFPIHRNMGEWAGYTQIFHADDPVLGPAPWHETNWRHAGGGDSFFQRKWRKEDKIRTSWYAMHIGPSGSNWCGRSTRYADGSVPEDSDAKIRKLREFMRLRGTVGGDKFHHEKL